MVKPHDQTGRGEFQVEIPGQTDPGERRLEKDPIPSHPEFNNEDLRYQGVNPNRNYTTESEVWKSFKSQQ